MNQSSFVISVSNFGILVIVHNTELHISIDSDNTLMYMGVSDVEIQDGILSLPSIEYLIHISNYVFPYHLEMKQAHLQVILMPSLLFQ